MHLTVLSPSASETFHDCLVITLETLFISTKYFTHAMTKRKFSVLRMCFQVIYLAVLNISDGFVSLSPGLW